jgi:hypothetical protein
MLERGIIPAVRLERKWIITRYAFEQWEKTCGSVSGAPGLLSQHRGNIH